MTTAYLPATLPPSGVVAGVNPSAATAIDKYHQLDAKLPPRRSPSELNEIDELRGRALRELGDDFFTDLDGEEAKLRDTLREELATLSSHWRRLEEMRALKAWRASPQNYHCQSIPAMSVASGGGYRRTISSRELLEALVSAVERS